MHRLDFIGCARDLGFSVAEIGELLSLWSDRSRQSADVKRLAQAHIAKLESRIASLREMADTLQELVGCCAGDERPDCPILADLECHAASDMGVQRQAASMGDFRDKVTARE